MENSAPCLNLPHPVHHSSAHNANESQLMAPTSSQSLLNFLPQFDNTDKGSMDLHAFSVATSENVHAEDLHSSFKMNESCNVMFDPFSSEQELQTEELPVGHDKNSSMNNFSTLHSSMQSGESTLLPSINSHEINVPSHQPQDQQISLSSHIFSKTGEKSVSAIPDFHGSLALKPLLSGQSFEAEGLCREVVSDQAMKILDMNQSGDSQSVDQHLDSSKSIFCDVCNLKVDAQSDLVDHLSKVHNTYESEKRNEYIFDCCFCPKAFKTQENLAKHEARHPYKTSAIQCSKCGEILGNYLLLQEHKQYEDYLSSCDICDKLFPNEECMMCHLRNTHNSFEEFTEEECNASQKLEESLSADAEHNSVTDGCVPEPLADASLQENIVGEELHAEEEVTGKVEISGISQGSSIELSSSSVQMESLSSLQTHHDKSEKNGSVQESTLCPLNQDNFGSFVGESVTQESSGFFPEDQQESGGEQSPAEENGSVSDSNKPQKMKCRYCSKKCSTRKSLIRHQRCHPYETAAMKCNLCLEVVENYKFLKIHKKKLAQVSCSTCNQLCPNELCLLCHVRNVHNNSVYDTKPIYGVSDDSNDVYNFGEREDASDEDEVQQFSVSRYATSSSEAPLRITFKQEKEENEDSGASPSFSAPTPPTPSTPSQRSPPTPSPPSFVPESEASDAVDEEEEEDEDNDDEYDPNAFDDSLSPQSRKSSKRKSSLRNARLSSLNSAQYLSSDGSDHNESGDNYSPEESASEEDSDFDADWGQEENSVGSKKRSRRKNPISDEDSDDDPDWRHAKGSSIVGTNKGRRKKGPLSDDSDDVGWRSTAKPSVSFKKKRKNKKSTASDDDSDNDPDWRKAESVPDIVKKKGTGKRGRPKKVQIAYFVPAIPLPKRPRAKGLGGQKAQDAATALAQAVEDMETSVPELKTFIRPVRRSVTKASLKRYCEIEDDEYDYLLDVKPEPREATDDSEHVKESSEATSGSLNHVDNEMYQGSNTLGMDDQGEQIVIKAEPYDFQDDDQSESTDLYFSQKFCETKYENKGNFSKKQTSGGTAVKREGYGCKLCGRAMQYRSHLIRHLRKVHDGEGIEEVMRRMMHCRFCSKPYTNELSLINHEKLHDGTSKMKCNKCEERFDDKNALRRHQRKTHWEHQPVECEICKKQLSDNTCLKAHMKHMHGSEEKKVTIFTCETCGRQLHTKTAFQNHVASKCGTNLLFPCETCGKSFSFKGSLKAHQLLHTGVKSFLCKFCGKAFHQKGEMKRHERKHTGEKPFICEVCGRAFAYRESLIGHSAVHTGIKPFPCKSCGMRFSCSGNLVKHRRSNNCKGFMEHGNSSIECIELENSEENTNINQAVPNVKQATGILNNSPQSLNPDCLRSDAHVSLGENLSNSVHHQSVEYSNKQEALVNMGAHVQDHHLNQGIVNNATMSAAMSISRGVGSTTMLDPRSVGNVVMPDPRSVTNASMSVPRTVNNVPSVCSSLSSASMTASSLISNTSMQISATSVGSPSMAGSHMTSVIKSAPSINVKPTSALQGMLKESRQSVHMEVPQAHGVATSTSNRLSGHSNTMYNSHENGVATQSNYGSHNIGISYSENHFRQANQVNVTDRRFMQFGMDGYTGRTDQYFDRQALMRHEMSRQVMDRPTSRFLDWTSGMQFSGMDSRNSLQSYSAASISHSSGYPNIHPGHLGNYAASHASSHSNNHANVYNNNAMMPGGVSFPAFAANNHIGMTYTSNNPITAHSVAHSSSYPASHMSHLEALFGHFSHGGTNNNFPRLSSHNLGTPTNPSLPSNNRV